MDCGLWVSVGGLLICGLLWCVGVIVAEGFLPWCNSCRGVIVAVVWWFACSVSEKRETKRKREKNIEMMML